MKRKRLLKLKKQYFDAHTGNPYDSRSICTSEIVKSANKLALQNNVIILEIKKSSWELGGVLVYTKASKKDYEKFCQEMINEFASYLESFSI